jgi:hypothetical protein
MLIFVAIALPVRNLSLADSQCVINLAVTGRRVLPLRLLIFGGVYETLVLGADGSDDADGLWL